MITAIVIPADFNTNISRVELEPTMVEGYQSLVGGWLERVELHHPEASMYLNEEGKIHNLELNRRASALLWVHNPTYAGRDVIAGDAFIGGPSQPDRQRHHRPRPAPTPALRYRDFWDRSESARRISMGGQRRPVHQRVRGLRGSD